MKYRPGYFTQKYTDIISHQNMLTPLHTNEYWHNFTQRYTDTITHKRILTWFHTEIYWDCFTPNNPGIIWHRRILTLAMCLPRSHGIHYWHAWPPDCAGGVVQDHPVTVSAQRRLLGSRRIRWRTHQNQVRLVYTMDVYSFIRYWWALFKENLRLSLIVHCPF